jgi:hypothetical protein
VRCFDFASLPKLFSCSATFISRGLKVSKNEPAVFVTPDNPDSFIGGERAELVWHRGSKPGYRLEQGRGAWRHPSTIERLWHNRM